MAARMEPPTIRSGLVDDLRSSIAKHKDEYNSDDLIIRGVWTTRYWLKLLNESTPFELQYLLVQTRAIGCCYYSVSTEFEMPNPSCIGASALAEFSDPALEIAALDAAYGALPVPGALHVLSGENFEKARSRASLIHGEAMRLLPSGSKVHRVGLVGVVGELLHQFRVSPGIEILATDYASYLADKKMEGVTIKWGEETKDMVAKVDVAVVTGMTLANGSLAGIIDVARRAGTKLVLFAETGHNFASMYLELGVHTVISEEFPFYLSCPGPSRVRVSRNSAL